MSPRPRRRALPETAGVNPMPTSATASSGRPRYATAWRQYVDAGWCPIPLPRDRKVPPPAGYTGRGPMAGPEQFRRWAHESPEGNLAVRVADDVIGIDVDDYGAKTGGQTLTLLEAELGPLPATFWSTSRNDGVSGIRFFRVPAGLKWRGKLTAATADGDVVSDIEIIQHGHRFATCWPSVHPDGRPYRWDGPDGSAISGPPATVDLAELPAAWIEEIAKTPTSKTARKPRKGAVRADAVSEPVIDVVAVGPPCHRVQTLTQQIEGSMTAGSRHEAILAPLLQLARLGQQGHPGVIHCLEQLHAAFVALAVPDRDAATAETEWGRSLEGIADALAGRKAQAFSLCSCHTTLFQKALGGGREYFNPRGHELERRVLNYLVAQGGRRHSRLVVESQRQIAHAVETRQATVGQVLRRLQDLGWLKILGHAPLSDTKRYLLSDPAAVMGVSALQGEAKEEAGLKADTPADVFVHHLFGTQGLGGACHRTFAMLAGHSQRVGNLNALRVSPGVSGKTLLITPRSSRRVPPYRIGAGVTVAELHAMSSMPTSTLRRHLRSLEANGLAFRRGNRWWRLLFEPNWLAERLNIPRTDLLRQWQFERDREQFNGSKVRLPDGHPGRLDTVLIDGHRSHVHPRTGEIKWMAGEAEGDREDERTNESRRRDSRE
jgi:DNA-binding MarR family transcriptional regulator